MNLSLNAYILYVKPMKPQRLESKTKRWNKVNKSISKSKSESIYSKRITFKIQRFRNKYWNVMQDEYINRAPSETPVQIVRKMFFFRSSSK